MSKTNKLFVFAIAVLSMVMSAVAALSFANINFGNGAKNQSNQVVENHQNQDDSNDYVDSKHVVKYDYLPIEVENGVLMAYTGEDNAVLKVPSSYSVREDGKLVEGDDYRITKIGENAFKGIKFAYCEVDMTNINEVGESALENAKNVHIINGQNGYHIGDYAFKNAKVVLDQIVLLADKGNKKAVGAQAFTGTQKFDISLAKTLANAGIVWADVIPVDSDAVTITTTATRGILTFGAGTSSAGGNMTATAIDLENFKGIVVFGDYAFGGYGLSNMGYYTCSNKNETLKSVKLGSGMYSIGEGSFFGCSNLGNESPSTNVFSMKGSITSLGDYAFTSCKNMKSFNFEKITANAISANCFSDCTGLVSELKIPNCITEIKGGAFAYCTSLTGNLTIRKGITNIGGKAFYYCRNLTGDLIIPSTITTFSSSSFEGCSGLTSVVFEYGLTEIPSSILINCTGLTSITIPNSVTNISTNSFRNCSSLKSLTIPDSVTNLSDRSCVINCTALEELVVGNGVGGIPTVSTCTNLKRLIVGNNVTSLVDISALSNLEELVIGDKVTSGVTTANFASKTKLHKLVIGKGVTSLPSQLLKDCVSLEDLTIPFVGSANRSNVSTSSYPLGYIFSGSASSGLQEVTQNYHGNYTTSYTSATYYIPVSLKRVTVTGKAMSGSPYTCIPAGSFYNCSMLENIVLGDNVTFVDETALYGCTQILNCTSPYLELYGNAYYLKNHSGDKVFLIKAKNTNITTCQVAETTKYIYDSAFEGCSTLNGIYIPNTVESIGTDAFKDCSNLTGVKKGTSHENGFIIYNTNTRVKIVYGLFPSHSQFNYIGAELLSECNYIVHAIKLKPTEGMRLCYHAFYFGGSNQVQIYRNYYNSHKQGAYWSLTFESNSQYYYSASATGGTATITYSQFYTTYTCTNLSATYSSGWWDYSKYLKKNGSDFMNNYDWIFRTS